MLILENSNQKGLKMKYALFSLLVFIFSCTSSNDSKAPTSPSLGSTNSTSTTPPNKVYFYLVTASPTTSEQITLKNNSGSAVDIGKWTLGDLNNQTAYTNPTNVVLQQGETKSYSHTTLGFQINDNSEVLYLKNTSGDTIDTWYN